VRLIHVETGETVAVGHAVVNFRHAAGTVTGWREPHKPGSEGFIEVDGREVYAGTFGCAWVDRGDK
jgi:hypothetical protein